MHRQAGGNRLNTAVGLGLTAGLFVLGLALVGAMRVLEGVLGGVEKASPGKHPGAGPKGAAA